MSQMFCCSFKRLAQRRCQWGLFFKTRLIRCLQVHSCLRRGWVCRYLPHLSISLWKASHGWPNWGLVLSVKKLNILLYFTVYMVVSISFRGGRRNNMCQKKWDVGLSTFSSFWHLWEFKTARIYSSPSLSPSFSLTLSPLSLLSLSSF